MELPAESKPLPGIFLHLEPNNIKLKTYLPRTSPLDQIPLQTPGYAHTRRLEYIGNKRKADES